MVEAQASDRIMTSASGASAATIESLRARLLSERAASKEARQQAQNIAQKVSELQTRLHAEIECRKKAEMAMNEVLKVLKVKGLAMEQVMANLDLPSENSASEESSPVRSSKDGESDQSSCEEASQPHMKYNCQDSVNYQGSVDDAVLTEDSVFEHREGCISEDSSSEKTQINSEDTSGSDTSEVEKEVMNKYEDGSSREQAIFTGPSKAHHNVSLVSPEKGEEGVIKQSFKSLNDPVKPAEAELCTGKSSANKLTCLPLVNHVNGHQVGNSLATSRQYLSGGHQVDAHFNEVPYRSDVKTLNGMFSLDTENLPGPRPKDVHPYFINQGYPYDLSHAYGDKVHIVPSEEAPFSRGQMSCPNPAHQNRQHVGYRVAELGRCQQTPISDAVLGLVDDKSGKLGSILMALHLAKQQVKEEEQTFSYMEEKLKAPSSIPYDRNLYPGYYEGVSYQFPYHPWKPKQHYAGPTIYFPISPTLDHEVSSFERHEGLRRSRSTSAYYMPSYDPYWQPKRELHLGNGITLYTD